MYLKSGETMNEISDETQRLNSCIAIHTLLSFNIVLQSNFFYSNVYN
jgi:hypothetical protein